MSEDMNMNDQNNSNQGEDNVPNRLDAKPAQGNSFVGIAFILIFVGIFAWGMYKGGVNRDEAKKELEKKNIAVTDASVIESIKKGDSETLNLLLKAGANKDAKGENDTPALTFAVNQNKSDMVKALLDRTAIVNIKNTTGVTPLLAAVDKNNFEIVKLLIDKQAAINIQDAQGMSPLMIAVSRDNIEIVKLLLEKGADFKVKNNIGQTAADLAKAINIKELLARAALPPTPIKPNKPQVPVVVSRQTQADVIEKLSPADAKKQLEALQIAYNDNRFIESVTKNEPETALLFIKSGMHPNIKNSDGINTLMEAARTGNAAIAKLLIEKGANVNAKDKNETTALIFASEKGSADIVKLLLEKGADASAKDKKGRSALSVNTNPDVKAALLKAGAK
ncbi:MAG TPA: ankyrin repeat domain-containing protein [Candidatus Wallbacteria bacterium]|nr:ankyrin repeat domain-containing protein [Candidatus Wallbacteria bacterium]